MMMTVLEVNPGAWGWTGGVAGALFCISFLFYRVYDGRGVRAVTPCTVKNMSVNPKYKCPLFSQVEMSAFVQVRFRVDEA